MLDTICFNDISTDNWFYMYYSNVQRSWSLHWFDDISIRYLYLDREWGSPVPMLTVKNVILHQVKWTHLFLYWGEIDDIKKFSLKVPLIVQFLCRQLCNLWVLPKLCVSRTICSKRHSLFSLPAWSLPGLLKRNLLEFTGHFWWMFVH